MLLLSLYLLSLYATLVIVCYSCHRMLLLSLYATLVIACHPTHLSFVGGERSTTPVLNMLFYFIAKYIIPMGLGLGPSPICELISVDTAITEVSHYSSRTEVRE